MTDLTPLARALIARCPDRASIPRYGTPEWDALPDQDPRRAAAVVIAAEAWRDHCSPERVAADLADDLAAVDRLTWARIRETSWDVADAIDWEARSRSPSYAELAERRGQPARAQQARDTLRERGVA